MNNENLEINPNVVGNQRGRKHVFKNERYFDTIDSDDKAYFLGLLWADGCNFRKRNAKTIFLGLKEEDSNVIHALSEKIFVKPELAVKLIIPKALGNFGYPRRRCSLFITSLHISDVLLAYGMTPRKSFTAKMPSGVVWTEDLFRAFLRGYFDGDGSIFYSGGSFALSIICSCPQAKEMNQLIEKFWGQQMKTRVKSHYKEPMIEFRMGGNYKTASFFDWLYLGHTVCLERKYKKYLQLKALIASKTKGYS